MRNNLLSCKQTSIINESFIALFEIIFFIAYFKQRLFLEFIEIVGAKSFEIRANKTALCSLNLINALIFK